MIYDLSIIIVSYNTAKLTTECLEAIFSQKTKLNLSVVVVDNNSSDNSVTAIKKFKQVTLIENKDNAGFAKANNQGIMAVRAKNYLLLNSDTVIQPDFFEKLTVGFTKFDLFSAQLLNSDLSFQPTGGRLPYPFAIFVWISNLDIFWPTLSFHINSKRYKSKLEWVGGTALCFSQTVIDKIGLLDDKIFMYAEDVDFCWRARKAGFRVGMVDADVVHFGGASSKNPAFSQWQGEFRGLIYLYQKNFGSVSSFLLKVFLQIFIVIRVVAFSLVGKSDFAKNYFKVLVSL